MLFKLTDCTAERSKSIFWRKNNLETVRQKQYHVIIGTVFLIQFTLVISQDFPCSLQSRVKWGIVRGRGSHEGVWHPPLSWSRKRRRGRRAEGGLRGWGGGAILFWKLHRFCGLISAFSKFLQLQVYNSWRTDFWNLGRAPKKREIISVFKTDL